MRRTSMTLAGTGTTTYAYDSLGRLQSVTDPWSDTTSYEYDSFGRLFKRTLPDSTYETVAFDNRGRPTSIEVYSGSNVLIDDYQYTWNAVGNVTQAVENGITRTYTYDSIDQLLSESWNTGYSTTYTYDANGNRLSRNVNGALESYTYDAGDKLLGVSWPGGSKSYSYDAAGRTTSIFETGVGTSTFTYDYEGSVATYTPPASGTRSYSYNTFGARVSETVGANTDEYVRDGVSVVSSLLSDGEATYTDHGVRSSSGSVVVHSGLQNALRQSGSGTATMNQSAFGETISTTGNWSGAKSFGSDFGYQESDSLYLVGVRSYDPESGRFLTRDPSHYEANAYGFAGNNPVTYVDPDGMRQRRGVGHDRGRGDDPAYGWSEQQVKDEIKRLKAERNQSSSGDEKKRLNKRIKDLETVEKHHDRRNKKKRKNKFQVDRSSMHPQPTFVESPVLDGPIVPVPGRPRPSVPAAPKPGFDWGLAAAVGVIIVGAAVVTVATAGAGGPGAWVSATAAVGAVIVVRRGSGGQVGSM